jgi:uncharacterized membrane protein YczE
MVRGYLGLAPSDVLHSGLIRYLPITLGQAVVLMSFVVMLAWIPLREVPGIGTVLNALLVGTSADATLWLLGRPDGILAQAALMLGGIVLCGLASALYIGAQFGRGPRDGLMTWSGAAAGRCGWSVPCWKSGWSRSASCSAASPAWALSSTRF